MQSNPSAVKVLGKILLYLAIVVLLGALLSPPIYWLVQALAQQGVLETLARFPFHRYFNRTVQVSAFVLLVPLLLWLRIRSVAEFGLQKNPRAARDLAAGVLLALLPAMLLGAAYLWGDVYRLKKEWDFLALPRLVLTAGFVALVEEFLFRGVTLGLAAKSLGRWPAVLLVSAVFAGVHFIKPGGQPDAVVEWWTGFAQIPRALGADLPPAQIALGFLNLLVIGVILGWAALRTRSLWLPIGLHAGWIFGQQSLQWLAKYRIKPPDTMLPWIGPNVVSGAVPTGLAPLLVLLFTGMLVWLFCHYGLRSQDDR